MKSIQNLKKYELKNIKNILGGVQNWIENRNSSASESYPNGDNVDWTVSDGGTGCEVHNTEVQDGIGGGHCDGRIDVVLTDDVFYLDYYRAKYN